jgi:hypothetical protein
LAACACVVACCAGRTRIFSHYLLAQLSVHCKIRLASY